MLAAGQGSPSSQGESPPAPSGSLDRDARPPFGAFGRGPFSKGGGPGRESDFAKLTDEERAKVRSALEAAWKTPEVEAAKDKAMKANEEFRKAMEAAVSKADPEAAKILAKIRPPTPWDIMRDRIKLPRPEDPKFVDAAVGRLSMELYGLAKPEHRDAAKKLHERVMSMPTVAAAVEKLRSALPVDKMTALKTLGEEYRKQVEIEVARLRKEKPKSQATEP